MKCQAAVRRLVRRAELRYRGASGSRQVNDYEVGRCTREAVVTVRMYPNDQNAMHPVDGRVCEQHAAKRLPRMAPA